LPAAPNQAQHQIGFACAGWAAKQHCL
jgi:hypothetical protein